MHLWIFFFFFFFFGADQNVHADFYRTEVSSFSLFRLKTPEKLPKFILVLKKNGLMFNFSWGGTKTTIYWQQRAGHMKQARSCSAHS